ncbi:hypothetical protein G6F31_016879 [Rhizopus arrhizus]|nr:hypothetical protein G6F31_016879 [Rhizopus arrhizus]
MRHATQRGQAGHADLHRQGRAQLLGLRRQQLCQRAVFAQAHKGLARNILQAQLPRGGFGMLRRQHYRQPVAPVGQLRKTLGARDAVADAEVRGALAHQAQHVGGDGHALAGRGGTGLGLHGGLAGGTRDLGTGDGARGCTRNALCGGRGRRGRRGRGRSSLFTAPLHPQQHGHHQPGKNEEYAGLVHQRTGSAGPGRDAGSVKEGVAMPSGGGIVPSTPGVGNARRRRSRRRKAWRISSLLAERAALRATTTKSPGWISVRV